MSKSDTAFFWFLCTQVGSAIGIAAVALASIDRDGPVAVVAFLMFGSAALIIATVARGFYDGTSA